MSKSNNQAKISQTVAQKDKNKDILNLSPKIFITHNLLEELKIKTKVSSTILIVNLSFPNNFRA
jgi:hypothetical protein